MFTRRPFATTTFTIGIPAGFGSLALLVWADDTAGVRLDGGGYLPSTTAGASAPNPTQGFARAQGGPLTQEQIDSLSIYLYQNYPKKPMTAAARTVTLPPLPGGLKQ